jgi:hypothetical protein
LHYWTEQQARDFLPRLRMLLGVIRRATQLEVRARGNGHASIPGAKVKPVEVRSVEVDAEESAPQEVLDAESALRELDEQGIILRDPQRGLIDFPARHAGGRDVLLCWQLGEDDLRWWHLPEDGFAGRRPLPMPPEL